MSLEFTSIPLAFIAGVVGIMSPCVWPLVPVVMSSAATGGKSGPLYLALGLSTAFAVAGTFLTLVLLNLGLNPDAYRYVAAGLLLFVGAVLLSKKLSDRVSIWFSQITSRFQVNPGGAESAGGQFGVGLLLGFVWLPCVGPTLGAAIALASLGQEMAMAFTVMFAFGIGTAGALLFAGYAASKGLKRIKPNVMQNSSKGKQLLGGLLVGLSLLVFTGVDKILEAYALQILPTWATGM